MRCPPSNLSCLPDTSPGYTDLHPSRVTFVLIVSEIFSITPRHFEALRSVETKTPAWVSLLNYLKCHAYFGVPPLPRSFLGAAPPTNRLISQFVPVIETWSVSSVCTDKCHPMALLSWKRDGTIVEGKFLAGQWLEGGQSKKKKPSEKPKGLPKVASKRQLKGNFDSHDVTLREKEGIR